MTSLTSPVSNPDQDRARRNLRLALWLGLLAAVFYGAFFFAVGNRG